MEEKIWARHLLDDVQKDVIRKSQGMAVTEQVYSAIIEIIKLTQVAREEGLLALEEAMKNDIESGQSMPEILPMGIEYIVDGLEDNQIAEILTTKYWVKNPQGMDALVYYICIQGIMQIREDLPVYYLDVLLTALLPEECLTEYEKRKEERIPKQVSKTQMEVLLEKELDLPRRSIIIRNVLEEKMNQAAESIMRASIQSLDADDDGWSAFLLRGLSKEGRKKLLSCMSPIRRDVVLEREVYMGPVRTIDIEDTLVSQRTIRRYIRFLEDAGLVRLQYSKKERSYVPVNGWFVPRDGQFYPAKLPDKKPQSLYMKKIIRLCTLITEVVMEEEEDPVAWYHERYPELSERTRQRDFKQLREAGYDIQYFPGDEWEPARYYYDYYDGI